MLSYILLVLALLRVVAAVTNQWQTLNGSAPIVIARGGYSGLFPEASEFAFQFALSTSFHNVVLFCDLQLTKDGQGICRSDIRLDNSTNIAAVYPKGGRTYAVNGRSVRGWFSVDFTSKQLFTDVTLNQNIFSRPSLFDGTLPMSTLDDVSGLKPAKLWLNVQYNAFFKQHNLDMGAFVLAASKRLPIDYLSSPEIDFLKGIKGKLPKAKLVFRFLDANVVEPTTGKSYGEILKDLKSIKTFASGILVPKSYIWPTNKDNYLLPHTKLVADAHSQELEVYASGFANDVPGSFNYSYDPTVEYLQFVDNSEFSVDGVLTDFPSTASEAIGCLAHNKNESGPAKGRPTIITHNGASGVYAGSTDLAYQKAIEDGADILDCSVQLSKDGIPFCLNSADLMGDTTAMASFMSRSSVVPEIQQNSGIFSFDLTWAEIQTLKPELTSPMAKAGLVRNPAYKNQGKLMALIDFLGFAKNNSVAGILINIENAAFLASKKGLDIVQTTQKALSLAGFEQQKTQQVLIQSEDSSVLSKCKQFPSYKRVLAIKEIVGAVPAPIAEEVSKIADAVTLPRGSIVDTTDGFVKRFTDAVDKMRAANVSVYVSLLTNEFTSIAFDYFSDPIVEICTYVSAIGVDGIVTDYPGTASAYFKSPCFNPTTVVDYQILPAQPSALLELAQDTSVLPPAEAPAPALSEADLIDPPLPPVNPAAADAPTTPPTTPPSGQPPALSSVHAAMGSLIILALTMSLLS